MPLFHCQFTSGGRRRWGRGWTFSVSLSIRTSLSDTTSAELSLSTWRGGTWRILVWRRWVIWRGSCRASESSTGTAAPAKPNCHQQQLPAPLLPLLLHPTSPTWPDLRPLTPDPGPSRQVWHHTWGLAVIGPGLGSRTRSWNKLTKPLHSDHQSDDPPVPCRPAHRPISEQVGWGGIQSQTLVKGCTRTMNPVSWITAGLWRLKPDDGLWGFISTVKYLHLSSTFP